MISKAYLFLLLFIQNVSNPVPIPAGGFKIPTSYSTASSCSGGPACKEASIELDYGITIYTGPGFRGRDQSFATGTYYGGKHCANYYGQVISFRVKPGYTLWLFDKKGRILKKALGNVDHYNKGFHKFVVRKIHDDAE